MKSNILPILRREYFTRVTTKGFWISTLLFPLLLAGFMIVPGIIAARSKARPEPVVVIDVVGDFYPVFVESMKNSTRKDLPPLEQTLLAGRSTEEVARELNTKAEKGEIQGYVIADAKALEDGKFTYFARNPSSTLGEGWFASRLREAVTRYRLSKTGLAGGQIDEATRRVDLDVRRATNDPKKQESGEGAFLLAFVLVMFIYASLIMYGMYVLRGVLEEKSNRIVEIIVSSVKPFEMMLGKILGIGAVGLTQVAIWTLFGLLTSAPQLAVALSISRESLPNINPMVLAFFPVYFILGYFLYATIYAGIGSMFNSEEDAQQMASAAVMFLVIPVAMLMPVLKNPSGTMATVMSLIPFFSPILMYLRIAVETPPAWQIALSIAIMLATIFLMTWLVARIYRVGILMYGKKPTLPEMIRWLRYS